MTTVALQPSGNAASREHYSDTIDRPVDQSVLARHLTTQQMEQVRALYADAAVPTWGVTPGKKNVNVGKWERLSPGSVTLFSAEGHVFASAVVTMKLHNAALAEELWGRQEDGQTWEYVYFLDEVARHRIPYAELNAVIGYAPNYVIQGFNVLNDEKSAHILATFELESAIHFPDEDEASTVELDEELLLDREGTTLLRGEQRHLRRRLFGTRRTGTCVLCHNELPVELLVAAHIKKRFRCSDDEKRDLANVAAPMCKMGCDELYERGFLGVVDGQIVVSPVLRRTPTLDGFLASVEGNEPLGLAEGNQAYYEWHRDNVFKG